MKYGFLIYPHLGGTYTVYRHLRRGLAEHGIDLHWIGMGRKAIKIDPNGDFKNEFAHGQVISSNSGTNANSPAAETRAVIEHIEHEQFDGVFVNVLTSKLEMNVVRYLPEEIKRIMILHNITPGTYAPAGALRDYVHATVGVSPRIARDLVESQNYPEDSVTCISNAIETELFSNIEQTPNDGTLRVLSLGRVLDSAKGVFWLEPIMRKLLDQPVRLTIAGDGPDREELTLRCRGMENKIDFLGRVLPESVPDLMANHDVFIMPSRYEGLPMTLLEMMAGGVVPVTSLIRGITDEVITNDDNGYTFEMGDTNAAAEHIKHLAQHPEKVKALSKNARKTACERFTLSRMAEQYANLIHQIKDTPLPVKPLSIKQYALPPEFKPGLRKFAPEWLKNFIRQRKEK